MRRRLLAFATAGFLIISGIAIGCAQEDKTSKSAGNTTPVIVDTVSTPKENPDRYARLSDTDFEKVAQQLQVETAAIKAVVSIEAGAAMQGFWAPGIPVINFDRTMYR
ncbi:MAG: N-acetylmuramidase family protein, partial [Muribaculaceae bacterium]|nr:N-acetylmuramidase family protein [Muribaculaceae bacterium]